MKPYKFILACVVFAGALATNVITVHGADQFLVIPSPSDLKWGDTGPQFPNTQFVLLDGDPASNGPVAFRFRCPDKYKFLAHTHPGPERVTVLAGTLLIGIGEKFDAATLKEVKLGGYFVIPIKAPHYGECKGETIIEVHTDGPLGTTYVNPADDPSMKK